MGAFACGAACRLLPTILSSVEVIASTGDVDFSIAAGPHRRTGSRWQLYTTYIQNSNFDGGIAPSFENYFQLALLGLGGIGYRRGLDKKFPQIAIRRSFAALRISAAGSNAR
jgi:hypothetical protein